jgi:hypothetical protein
MTRNYDKFCELFEEQIDALKRAVENLDRKNVRWHSYKIEGMLDAAWSILNAEEGAVIYNKYRNYPDFAGMDGGFHKKMESLYGVNWE